MMNYGSLWEWLAGTAIAGVLISLAGLFAAQLCRQPARKLRIFELTIIGLLVCPWLPKISRGTPIHNAPVARIMPIARPQTTVRLVACNCNGTPHTHPYQATIDDVITPPPVEPTRPAPAPAPVPALAPVPRQGLGTGRPIVALYLGGALGLSAWWLLGLAAIARLRRLSKPIGGSIAEAFGQLTGRGGEKTILLESSRVQQPITIGFGNPVIVLPEGWRNAEPEPVKYALAHEWSHVERHDTWTWQLANLAQLLFWYNPLAWRVRSQLRLCQDFLADSRAAELAPSAEDYASFLIATAGLVAQRPSAAFLSLGDGASHLSRRVLMLISSQRALEKSCPRVWNLAAIVLAAIVVVASSVLPPAKTIGADDTPTSTAITKNVSTDSGGSLRTCNPRAVMAGPLAPPPPAPPVQQTRTMICPLEPVGEPLVLEGKVLDRDTKKPIADAEVVVTLSQMSMGCATYPMQLPPTLAQSRSKTGTDGKYSFSIPAQFVKNPGFGWSMSTLRVDAWHPTSYVPLENVSVPLGEVFEARIYKKATFLERIEMTPAPTLDLVGKVVDKATGKPIESAKVTIRPAQIADKVHPDVVTPIRGGDGISTVETNAKGEFSFSLPPSVTGNPDHIVTFELSHPTSYGQTSIPGETVGAILEKRAKKEHPFYEKLAMEEAHGPKGQVVGEDGQPLRTVVSVHGAERGKSRYRNLGHAVGDEKGRFQLPPSKAGDRFMLLVQETASSGHPRKMRVFVDRADGDAGTIVLKQGLAIHGRLFDAAGKPMAKRYVLADEAYGNREDHVMLSAHANLNDFLFRGGYGQTDDQGFFEIPNLQPGIYQVMPSMLGAGVGEPRTPMPKLHLPKKVTLAIGAMPESCDLRPVPFVLVEARVRSGVQQSNPGERVSMLMQGMLGETPWQALKLVENNSAIFEAPKNLTDASIELCSVDAVRSGRLPLGPDNELPEGKSRVLKLGTLTRDIRDIWFVRQGSPPSVLFRVRAADGGSLEGLEVHGAYVHNQTSDSESEPIDLLRQGNGVYRTLGLVPEEFATFAAHASGYLAVSKTVKLASGMLETVELVLEPIRPGKGQGD